MILCWKREKSRESFNQLNQMHMRCTKTTTLSTPTPLIQRHRALTTTNIPLNRLIVPQLLFSFLLPVTDSLHYTPLLVCSNVFSFVFAKYPHFSGRMTRSNYVQQCNRHRIAASECCCSGYCFSNPDEKKKRKDIVLCGYTYQFLLSHFFFCFTAIFKFI